MGRSKIVKPRCMILKAGCPAIHKLGDIGSSPDDELIDVFYESKNYYIGSFFYGFGFIHVKFKKEDVRPMNEEELAKQRGKNLPWHWDDEGYYLEDV
jgi:hypothetical protein